MCPLCWLGIGVLFSLLTSTGEGENPQGRAEGEDAEAPKAQRCEHD